MSDQESDENWLVSEPVVAQWHEGETRRSRYLGFSSPASWRSHLTLNLGLDISDAKREALVWFRLPIRVKSKSAKRPTKFYLYFIIELDMFDVNGEDQGLSFSQPSVPPAVGFAFKGSNICESDDDIIRLRFNLTRPGVVVMPKAEECPFEPSAVNKEVLLALKSLSETTKFNIYMNQKSLSISRLQTLCWMVHHGGLQSRPRDLNTLYHGKGGEVNAWQNFGLPDGQDAAQGPSAANTSTEAFFAQESMSFAEGSEAATKATAANKPSSSEKQAMPAEMKEQGVVDTVEKAELSKAAQQHDAGAERQGSIPPAYEEVLPPAQLDASAVSTPEERPSLKATQSFSLPPVNRVVPPERTRQSSAPPTFRSPIGPRHVTSVRLQQLAEIEAQRAGSKAPVEDGTPSEMGPPSYKRSKPPSDDEIDEEWEPAPPPTKDAQSRKPRPKPKPASKPRSSKKVRFDATATRPHRASPPRYTHRAQTPSSSSPSMTMTATARALQPPHSTLLRHTIDWFKWAWTTSSNRHAHVSLTPTLLALGYHARVGDVEKFYATRARCSAGVLWECEGNDGAAEGSEEQVGGRKEELEAFLVWMAGIAPEAEMGLAGELRELGRLARAGAEDEWVHACAVCSGFAVWRFGRVEEQGSTGRS